MRSASNEFSLDNLRESLPMITSMLDEGKSFAIQIQKSNPKLERVLRFLAVLDGAKEVRSPLRSLVDAWKIQDFITVLGLASERNFFHSTVDLSDNLEIVFEMSKRAAD